MQLPAVHRSTLDWPVLARSEPCGGITGSVGSTAGSRADRNPMEPRAAFAFRRLVAACHGPAPRQVPGVVSPPDGHGRSGLPPSRQLLSVDRRLADGTTADGPP